MSVNNLKAQKRGGFYWKEEKPYVSVTEILKVIDKPALRYWFGEQIYWAMVKDPTLPKEIAMRAPYEVSDKAKSRGTTVHSIVEAYKHTGGEIEVAEEFKGYQDAFSKFISDTSSNIIEQEKSVFSETHKYAGTLDLLVEINGANMIIDVKTGKDIYREAMIQASAYKQAINEMGTKVDRAAILLLREDGTYKFEEADELFDTFLACKTLWEGLNGPMLKKLGYL